MIWMDKATGSKRQDGAKVGLFFEDGRPEWWAYPKEWKPRCEFEALGPFETREQAKYAIETWLGLEIPNE